MGSLTAVAPKGTTGAAPNPILNFVPLIFVLGILYFLLIRPQQKQVKEHKKLVDNLKAGDRVITQGGIFGTVVSLKPESIQVKISENVKVDVLRSAITQILTESTNGAAPASIGERS